MVYILFFLNICIILFDKIQSCELNNAIIFSYFTQKIRKVVKLFFIFPQMNTIYKKNTLTSLIKISLSFTRQ